MTQSPPLNQQAFGKLRWRCRRGLLENDLFIASYFAAHAASMTQADAQALAVLMDLSDYDLLDLLLRKTEPAPALATPQILQVLEQLRNASPVSMSVQ